MVKFPVLSLILIPDIPSQYQVSQLEIILLGSLIKDLLNVILDDLSLVEHILSSLLQVNHLIDSSMGVIWLSLYFLK